MSEAKSSGGCGCGKSHGTCATKSTESKTPSTKAAGIQNGKGSAPRNISEEFRQNYNGVKWSSGGKLKKGEKFVKVYG
ncbi:MAG: hypothetical protein PHD76_07305 [Methylacidiphilales bacterium]|nr:hypothetical protein [Candidatus Methylacidiphilales bacterium]